LLVVVVVCLKQTPTKLKIWESATTDDADDDTDRQNRQEKYTQ
jgi:hypothetical protein